MLTYLVKLYTSARNKSSELGCPSSCGTFATRKGTKQRSRRKSLCIVESERKKKEEKDKKVSGSFFFEFVFFGVFCAIKLLQDKASCAFRINYH
jgi:hypothetical protein